MSCSGHANNKIRNILVLGKDFIQGIDNTTIYAKKKNVFNVAIYLSTANKLLILKQKTLKLCHIHYGRWSFKRLFF